MLARNADVGVAPRSSRPREATFRDVTVVFSEPISPASLANFAITPGSLTGIAVLNPTTVRLTTGVQTPGTKYTLTVNGVKDTASVANSIAADSKKDFYAFRAEPRLPQFEYYADIAGATVAEPDRCRQIQDRTPTRSTGGR